LVERARRKVDAREIFNVFHECVSVFVAASETGENEDSGRSVSTEALKSV
jgi:hypothetical protein